MNSARGVLMFLGTAVFSFFPSSAIALSSPSAADLQVFQGEERFIEIPIQNDTADQKTIAFTLVNVEFDDSGDPILGTTANDVSWLELSETNVVLEPGEMRSVNVTASPGDEISSGSYVFALISTETQEGAYVLAHGTATLLFFTVGFVESEVRCILFAQNSDGTFSLTLQNAGQGILYDEGEILLRGPFDIVWAASSSNPSHHRVFAGQTRTWTSEPVMVPWWAFGSLEYSLESDLLLSTCPRITAGFGWIPVVIGIAGIVGVFVARRRP